MSYAAISIVCGLDLPGLEGAYLASYTVNVSVKSKALLSAVASGTMVLTGIVFSIVFMAQFSAIAYLPRLVFGFAREPVLFHSIGVFVGPESIRVAG
jgi:uncharacterized membrane protein